MAFGGAIKLTGESEYRKALKNISQNLKEVSSELKVATSSFDKNDKSVNALTARQDVLNKRLAEQQNKLNLVTSQYKRYEEAVGQSAKEHEQLGRSLQDEKAKLSLIEAQLGQNNFEYQAQKLVVDQLEKEYKDSTKAQDDNAESLRKLRVDMNNAQSDVNKTSREIDNLEKEIKDANDPVKQLGDAFKKAGDEADNASKGGFTVVKGVISNLATKAITSAINGLKKLGSALVNVGKEAIASYADYEQLVGGVETLFKDSASIVEGYANSAYKTAGMSANQYMETVTSFSASLLQGLNNDTKKSAEIADMAITDMADNANKMGTSMEMVQNAYQGFAKSNFSMLDNLKLGYGGTKTEMIRLINDSGVLGKTIEDLDNVSLDQIFMAIHKIQEEMGITGTTAKEASETISGSTASMKSAWQNLLTGIADENQDMGPLVDAFVESVITAGKNLAPRIKDVLSGLGETIAELWNEVVPELAEEFPSLQPIVDALQWIIDNGPTIVSVLSGIVAGIMAFKVAGAITTLVTGFQTFFTTIQAGQGIMAGLNAVMSANPIGLIAMAVAGLVTAFITLWNTSEGFRNFWIGMWENIKEAFNTAISVISEGLSNAWNNIVEGFTVAKDSVVQVWDDISTWFIGKWDAIKEGLSNVGTWFSEKFTEAKEGVINAFKTIPDWFRETFSSAWQKVKDVFSTGGKIFDGIKDGIAETFKAVVNRIISGMNRIISIPFDKINSLLYTIRNASFLGIQPFRNLGSISIPQIPLLAKGGVLKKGQIGLLEGNGAEAVVPLEQNTKWIDKVANKLREAGADTNQVREDKNMVEAFKTALSQMKIELDDEVAGKFVERTVARTVFS